MPLHLVPDDRAGPAALGILVPPGVQTILVVRPRSLPWDLLLVQGLAGTSFRAMNRAEATATAREFYDALHQWGNGGPGHVQAVGANGGFLVWVDVGDFCLVACERRPGEPYRPGLLIEEADARQLATTIAAILHPRQHEKQEVYFNIRHFST
jgi:hypothetical protein